MPFKYVINSRRLPPESLSVEAFFRYPQSPQHREKPVFAIGRAKGSRILTIHHALEDIATRYPSRKRRGSVRIPLDHDDATAYRIGLATALLHMAKDSIEMERGVRHVLSATLEEIWFWSSKWFDEDVSDKALQALVIISGSKQMLTA